MKNTLTSKTFYKVAFGLLVLSFIMPGVSKAATMSPIRTELTAEPGATVKSTFKLINDKATAEKFYISAGTFESKDESGEPLFTPEKRDLATWIQLPQSLTLQGKETVETEYTITVPKGTDPGGYFAGIFASTIPPVENGTNVSLEADLGTLVLLTVSGDFKEGEKIVEFNTKDKKTFYSSLPVEFYYRFQNSGADRIKPVGDITIKNMFGGITKKISANRIVGNILPKSIRKFDAAWVHWGGGLDEQLNPTIEYEKAGDGFFSKLRWQWQHFALGKYSANLKMIVNNDTNRVYSAKTSFWVVPWLLLFVIVIIALIILLPLITLIVVIRRMKKKYRK